MVESNTKFDTEKLSNHADIDFWIEFYIEFDAQFDPEVDVNTIS